MASDSFQFNHTNVKWLYWTGSLPNGAVSIYNEKCKRTEYVAKVGLHSGFYSPSLDGNCHYSAGGREYCQTPFDILVNIDNFELLAWKPGSYGSVPDNAIKTLQASDTYVGRGEYGLGKVNVSNTAFFYPWNGKEYWSKHYDVLTFSRDTIKEEIFDVRYKTDAVHIIHRPPEIISQTTVENKDDHETTLRTQLTKAITESNSWSATSSLAIGASATITTGVPIFTSGTFGVTVERSFGYEKGSIHTESITKSVIIQHKVPSMHSCTVKMELRLFSTDIPFTARLQRTYRNEETTQTTITGTYKGVHIAEVRGVVEPCVPIKQH